MRLQYKRKRTALSSLILKVMSVARNDDIVPAKKHQAIPILMLFSPGRNMSQGAKEASITNEVTPFGAPLSLIC